MRKFVNWSLVIMWGWIIWYLTQYPNLVVTPSSFWDTVISDSSHFFFFGTLAILLCMSLSTIYKRRSTIYSITLTSLYGVVTELHQHFVPGRTPDPMDWALDTAGAMLFIVIMAKYKRLRSTINNQ